eukprot:TRINITY_DN50293_c0_g1_i1.p1 TRINITY_DN50293_c0_g1~~TRINITY_DN50293_c0_g1_i1.p1  ORF type:complete len:534 (+),score=112.57 TRINITY_DN50293_c0_g1_i1:142-1743(+)
MSEHFRKLIKREPPPAALIRFRCAKLHRVASSGHDSKDSEYNTIYDVLRSRGWKETDIDNEWHIFWTDKDWIHSFFDKIHLDPHQHVNHFLNHYELTRKDLLVKNMKRMKRQCEKEGRHDEAAKYNICPVTFVVPQEYSMFVEEFKKWTGATWIMKPVGRSQGSGIFLINKLAQTQQWKPKQDWSTKPKNEKDPEDNEEGPELYVVQKYVESPLLIGGKKFDMRLYVCVTSYQPLTVYMHRGGFCRFSMSRYSSDKSNLSDLGSHLTNVAVQKHSGKAAYKRTGAKWDVNNLKTYLLTTVGLATVNRLFSDIEAIVIHSLLSVQKVMINDKHCFELYGYDILIDTDYKPWLLEVNASPSLTANTMADYDMKFGLLDDVLTLLDIEKYLAGSELQIGGFDLLYRDGYRYSPPEGATFTSYLGCANNRLSQLERLAKTRAWELRRERRDGSKDSASGAGYAGDQDGVSELTPPPRSDAQLAPPQTAAQRRQSAVLQEAACSPRPDDARLDVGFGASSKPRQVRLYPPPSSQVPAK